MPKARILPRVALAAVARLRDAGYGSGSVRHKPCVLTHGVMRRSHRSIAVPAGTIAAGLLRRTAHWPAGGVRCGARMGGAGCGSGSTRHRRFVWVRAPARRCRESIAVVPDTIVAAWI